MKRYPFVGKSITSIQILIRRGEGFGLGVTLRNVAGLWLVYETSTSQRLLGFARCSYEGIGVNGPIISVLIHNGVMIGELVTDKLTGRNLIYVNAKRGGICFLRMNVPRSTWNQAVQISAFKWISERRSA